MLDSIHSVQERLQGLEGGEACAAMQRLAEELATLPTDARMAFAVEGGPDAWIAMARVCNEEEAAKTAGHYARKALTASTGPARRAMALLELAVSLFNDGAFAEVIDLCRMGMAACDGLSPPVPLLRAQLEAQSAIAFKHIGRRDEALACNFAALARLPAATDRVVQELRATLHNNIAVILLTQGDTSSAIQHFELGIEVAEQLHGTESIRVMQHLNLGRILLTEGDHTGAAHHLERGSDLAAEVGSVSMRLRAAQSLAMARRNQGRPEEALALMEPVLAHWEADGASLSLASALLSRGRILADLGRRDAERDLERAYQIGEASSSFDILLESAQLLTQFLEARGRYFDACTWHERRHAHEKEQYDLERTARMEEMKARHRVEQAESDLVAAKELAEAASRAKSQFLAVTSHELRTPLNAIIGYTELLGDDAADGVIPTADELGADIGRIHTAAQRLQRLIDRILALSSLGDGRTPLRLENLDARALLADTIERLRPAAEESGNTLIVELSDDLSARPMRTDPMHLAQVLQHLVDNAGSFTQNGSITVRAGVSGGALHLQVIDTGVGFDASALETLTQPFHQTDMSYTRGHEGLGLGLALCSHQCDLLGGSLTATSIVGKGSTFVVRLPWTGPPEV